MDLFSGLNTAQEEAVRIGVDIFLKKPFNEYKVISSLAKLCD